MLPTISQKKVFEVSPDLLGNGRVIFQWSPKGNYLAAAGPKVSRMGRMLNWSCWGCMRLHGHACMCSGRSTSLIATEGSTMRSRCPSPKCSSRTPAARPAWSCRCVGASQSAGTPSHPLLLMLRPSTLPLSVGSGDRAAGHPAGRQHDHLPLVGGKQGSAED